MSQGCKASNQYLKRSSWLTSSALSLSFPHILNETLLRNACAPLNRQSAGFTGRRSDDRIPAESNRWFTKVILVSLLSLALGITRLGKDWLAQYQDTMTEWDIRSWCWWPVSQWGSTIKSPWVHTITNWYPPWYIGLKVSRLTVGSRHGGRGCLLRSEYHEG